ncbi:MAG: cobalamin-binding domain-containing protein [Firmicutes bacterium]|nr:cobalamin-binding domain-containing protein [Bacillota bacterium]
MIKGKVLLLEPAYRNKYPPMGLMKLSTFYKKLGYEVRFFKGDLRKFGISLFSNEFILKNPELEYRKDEIGKYLSMGRKSQLDQIENLSDLQKEQLRELKEKCRKRQFGIYDVVLVTTLFTFYWTKTVDTIKFAKNFVKKGGKIFVGGIASTILPIKIKEETDIEPIKGLLDLEKTKLLYPNAMESVDEQPLDYSILSHIEYKYPANDAYFAYTTRGCTNKCKFCAVPILEPVFSDFISIKEQILAQENDVGQKKDLLLLDNNVLASSSFDRIIDEIIEMGFAKGAMQNLPNSKRQRYVDFNQGIDARLITESNIKRLAEINIRPLRIAFDDYKLKSKYENAVRLAANAGIKNMSNYLLYNFKDTPEELYQRLAMNVRLCEELKVAIYSFPMKYHPIGLKVCELEKDDSFKNRDYIGKYWSRKFIRAIQAVLNSTKGKIGRGKSFFETAFGKDLDEFNKILYMPEPLIIYREDCKKAGLTAQWERLYYAVTGDKKIQLDEWIRANKFEDIKALTVDKELLSVLEFYTVKRNDIVEKLRLGKQGGSNE